MGGFSRASCFLCLGPRKKEVPPPPRAEPRRAAAAGTFAWDELAAFALDELAAATRNFGDDSRVFGPEAGLYKGYLKSINQIVSRSINLQHAAEQLNSEFLAHVLTLSALRHPNVVNLIGFCADGQYRILVHEHVPLGSLEDHLHPRDRSSAGKAPLDWNTRMNIAARVAKGLEYLHHKGVVYRKSMGSLDILLGDGYHPKMSQHGLADLGRLLAEDNKGWCTDFWGSTTIAPETYVTGKVTKESNVYSFGGLLLEMITGRRPIEPADEDRNLIAWATRLMKDRSRLRRMADPALQGRYLSMDLEEALTVASMCVHQQPAMRSPIGTVVTALSRLAYDVDPPESSHPAAPS
ncbi:serine/threonine-protein kinase PBL27-like isoform X1 [Triticum aestivum]|uniref:serine/threonine-protein kinase PBL27-like isoform X1 n=1 Tax=Triticum aestivum TaxID=4565 RepID=UPI001D02BEAA|nr:serine/threonine-protein kinase PBL27-like isoform X1 [Triticum aestivum]